LHSAKVIDRKIWEKEQIMTQIHANQKLAINREICVTKEGTPVSGVEILRVASNGTFIQGTTNDQGIWEYTDPFSGTVTFMTGASGISGNYVVMQPNDWKGKLNIPVQDKPNGGSIIIRQDSGEIPGLKGAINPIRDTAGRTYIYGNNISFSEVPEQPFRFVIGEPFTATDALNNIFELTILAILGRSSLVRYTLVEPSPLT